MIRRNVAGQGVYLFAYNVTAGAPKTGDQANITGYVSKDGAAEDALGSGVTQIDATNMPGVYWQALAQGETDGAALALGWKSSTAGVEIEPLLVLTEPAPGTAGGAAGASDYTAARAAKLDNLDDLDVAVSTRATPADIPTPPSAGTIADAVLDELLAGHVGAGSAGAALGLIDDIKAKTDTIEVGDLTIASPFDPESGRLTLVRGDDYPADQVGAIPPFTSSDWPDLTGATEIRLTVRVRPVPPDTEDPVIFTLTDTTASRVVGAGEQSVTFEPLSAPGDPVLHEQDGGTLDLIPGRARGKYDVQATLSDGTVRTLALGLVDVLEDQTRGEA